MASVKQFPGSRFWYACYTLPDGRRRQESTKKTDRSEALGVALQLERACNATKANQWNDGIASRLIRELRVIAGAPPSDEFTIGDWLDHWFESARPHLKPRTVRKYADCLKAFRAHLGKRADWPLTALNREMVGGWRDALVVAGKSKSTINGDLTPISRACGVAAERGILERNPCDGMAYGRKSAQQREAFSWEQFCELAKATDGEWRTMVLVTGFTAARQQEAAKLTWDRVDLKRGRITLVRGKSGDNHCIPLHPALARHLAAEQRKTSSVHVMPRIARSQPRLLSNEFRRTILPKVGIVQPFGEKAGVGRVLAKYSLHSLRHSLASWLDAHGATKAQRMLLLGHDDERIAQGYVHADLEQAAAALGRIPSIAL